MTGLRTVTPEERLLETMRLIYMHASLGSSSLGMDVNFRKLALMWAGDAIRDYEDAQRVQRTPNSCVIRGEIQSKGGR